jgi:biopolymer transport protein ExbD
MRNGSGTPRADINVTPLVDGCLVLLIIFLVVTPLLNHHGIELPAGETPGEKTKDEDAVTISVSWPDRITWYGESWLPEKEMLGRLSELHKRNASKRLIVVADHRLAYGDLRGLLRTANLAGFPGVELAATRERGTR